MLTYLFAAILVSMSAHATAVIYGDGPVPGPRTCESMLTSRTSSSEGLLKSMYSQRFRFEGRVKDLSLAESSILGLNTLDEVPYEDRAKFQLTMVPAVGGGATARLIGPENTTVGALTLPVQKLRMWHTEGPDGGGILLGVGYTSEPNPDGVRFFLRISNYLGESILIGIDFPCELAARFTNISKEQLEYVRSGKETLCRRTLFSFIGTGLPNK